jgi:hypothetical protein
MCSGRIDLASMSGYTERPEERAAKTAEEARTAARCLVAEGYTDRGVTAAFSIAAEQPRGIVVETQDAGCGV